MAGVARTKPMEATPFAPHLSQACENGQSKSSKGNEDDAPILRVEMPDERKDSV